MKKLVLACLLLIASALNNNELSAQITISAGSYIVDMGVNSSVKPAGLRPYGLIHELVKYYNVPVLWVVRQGKAKDAIDFTIEGNAYKGGLFIIPGQYVTATITGVINGWTTGTPSSPYGYNRGLVHANVTAAAYTFNSAKYDTIKAVPTWTLDAQSGSIAEGFITNAGIPAAAYNYLSPSQLTSCSDIFVMPHADPSWATHGNLIDWNLTYKGAIWLGCHAGSAMENMYNPDSVSEQANFLSNKTTTSGTGIILPTPNSTSYAQNSLQLWSNHSNASVPFVTNAAITAPQTGTAATADDWVSQFIGVSDAAQLNGSEQVYLPAKGQSWRPSTKIITYDPSQTDVPANSAGVAALIAYGYGYGDTARGLVMMTAGHSIDKGSVGDVAAQRAFFNWSFLATKKKSVVVSNIAGIPASGSITGSVSLSVNASSPVPLTGALTYTWSATQVSNGASIGSFSTNGTNAATTTYSPGTITSNTDIVISVKVTDACGRATTSSTQATLMPAPRAPVANNDVAQIMTGCYLAGISKTIPVLANDSDPDNNLNPSSLLLINPANSGQTGSSYTVSGVGTWTKSGTNIVFTPAANFFGAANINYKISDNTTPTPLSATATITVSIGTTDARGCFPGSVWDVASALNASGQTNGGVFNPSFALGDADYDPLDSTTYAEIDNNTDFLTLDFGSTLSRTAYDSIAIFFASDNSASSITASFEASTNGTAFAALGNWSTSLNDETEVARFVVPSGGIRYLRIKRTAGTAHLLIDAAEAEKYDCISAMPTATDDDIAVLEDVPAIIDVTSNDDNPGDYPLSISVTSAPAHGNVSINTDGTITYVNTTDYPGGTGDATDRFTYQICNSQGLCNSGTVNITINNDGCTNGQHRPATGGAVITKTFCAGLNGTTAASANSTSSSFSDALLDKGSPNSNKGKDAKIDVGRTQAKRAVYYFNTSEIPLGAVVQSATLSLFRESGDGLTQTVYVHALKKDFVENQVTWNKAATGINWSKAGGDYAASAIGSAVVSNKNKYYNFNVTSEVQNWVNDTLKNFGLLVKTGETINKRHEFTSSEGGGNKRPKLTVTYAVAAPCSATPNRAPLANPDYATTTTAAAISITPLSNDVDPDGNTNSLWSVSTLTSSLGTVSTSGNTINYTPNGSAPVTRIDTLLYTVSDGILTDSAFVFVTVNNATPQVNRDNSSANSGMNQVIDLAANDTDREGDALTDATITAQPKNGAYSLSGNTITYTPNPGFYGLDSLVYQRCEVNSNGCSNSALCDTALVVFTVNNRPPTATTKNVATSMCLGVKFSLNGSLYDPEEEALSVSILPYNTSKGTLTTNTDGSYTFYPAPNFPATAGTDTARILYQLTDPGMLSSIDTIIVSVSNPQVNHAPNAIDDLFDIVSGDGIGIANQDVTIDVLSNDYDADNNAIKVSISDASLKKPAHGNLQLLANGQIRYVPDFNFVGKDTFQYKLCDTFATPQAGCSAPTAQCDVATATVRIDLISTPSIRISGTVWNDVNGSANNSFSGIYTSGETGTNAAGSLFVYLINGSGNIIEKAAVANDGSYVISGAPASSSNLKLVLTNVNAQIGDMQPSVTLPAAWTSTAPLINGSVVTNGLYLTNKDFGIEQLPTAGAGAYTTQNLWGTTQVSIPGSAFISTSVSNDPTPGSITGILITAMPAGVNSIAINGTSYGSGFAAFPSTGVFLAANANGQPTQSISIDPSVNSATTVDIPFKAVDNAGKSSANIGHAVITLVDPSISGNVYDDGVSNNTITGTLISSVAGQPLYVNLVNNSGIVAGSVPVVNGSYTLNQPNGVLSNSNFNLVLSTVQGIVGTATGTTPLLPPTWGFTAEGTGAGDAQPDGTYAVTTGTTNATANFGLDQIPLSNNATAPKQLNPGGAKLAPVPTAVFTGSDAEDGNYSSGLGGKKVILYPGANGDLYYDGVKLTSPITVSGFSPNKVTIDPKGPDSTGWVAITSTFCYSIIDNAGYASTPDTITLPFDAALCINLRVYLEGALMNNGNAVASDGRPLMRDGLRNSPFTGLNIIPPFDPYTKSTAYVNVTGKSKKLPPQTTYTQFQQVTDSATVFSVTGPDAIVDWVYIELRNKNNNANIIGCRAGLLQRDGDIVDVDGVSCLKFPDVPIDSYYVSVEHRTHLGTMTKYAQSPATLQTLVDFTVTSTPLWDKGIVSGYNYSGLSQKANVKGTYRAMWQGDFNCDGKIKYDSPNDDLSTMPFEVRRHPNNTKQTTNNDFAYGYRQADYDMNGKVKFDNPNDDNAMLLFQVRRYPVNVNHATNFDLMIAQLP